jgi:hypothetical protein
LDIIDANHKKGRSYLWNEKGYILLRSIYQRIVNGEEVNETLEEAFASRACQCQIVNHFEVKGKFDPESTFLLLLLENASSARNIISDSAPLASVCTVQGKGRKVLTSIVLAKKL